MKKQIVIVGALVALAGSLAGGCASTAPTQTARTGCSYTVVAGKAWDAEGVCTLQAMEWENEKMKQENRMNSGWLSSSASE